MPRPCQHQQIRVVNTAMTQLGIGAPSSQPARPGSTVPYRAGAGPGGRAHGRGVGCSLGCCSRDERCGGVMINSHSLVICGRRVTQHRRLCKLAARTATRNDNARPGPETPDVMARPSDRKRPGLKVTAVTLLLLLARRMADGRQIDRWYGSIELCDVSRHWQT